MTSPAALDLTQAVAVSLRGLCAERRDFGGCVRGAREAISRAVVEGHDLDQMWRESDPDKRLPGRYRRHQVVHDEEHGFTVVVLLWEPGACTPIHDHDTWCIFGLLEGSLEVTDYRVRDDDGEGTIVLAEHVRAVLGAGEMGDNSGLHTEVHRVRNVGTERAISLHVYGADLTQRTLFNGRGISVDGKGQCMAFLNDPAY
jgi:predicted metal-dependent enzyme (double-stranded beta helix superfamily)